MQNAQMADRCVIVIGEEGKNSSKVLSEGLTLSINKQHNDYCFQAAGQK